MSLSKWKSQPARCVVVLMGAAGLLSSALPASAGGVVASADESSLRAAFAGGGTVTFAIDGTIPLSSSLFITNDTVVDGSGHTVTISGNNAVRVFYINAGVQFTLQNLVVANGRTNAGAAVFNAGGFVTVSNCIFSHNQVIGATGASGGFSSGPGESVTGGAVYNSGSFIFLNGSFTNNMALGGAGGLPGGPEGNGGAGGNGSGGGIYNLGTLGLTNTTFISNAALGGNGGNAAGNSTPGGGGSALGGVIFNLNGSLTGSNCNFALNTASAGVAGGSISGRQVNYRGEARGGAIYNPTGTVAFAVLTMTNNTVSGAPASGGALHHGSGALTISNAVLMNNSTLADRTTTAITSIGSTGSGGAIHNSGSATLTDCLVSSNVVSGGHGIVGAGSGPGNGGDAKAAGIYNSGTLGISRCTLAGNSGSGGVGGTSAPGGNAYGGGVMNDGGSLWLVNCTLTGNKVAGPSSYGGGICNGAALTNCTLANNRAASGGNVAFPGSSVNSIFTGGISNNVFGVLVDLGHNISSDSSTPLGGVGSLVNTDPKLGPLGNYGGLTPTMPLLGGSPAIDSGDTSSAPNVDQRGRTRPSGSAADIGAFESSSPYVIAGTYFGMNASDSILAVLDGATTTNVPSGGSFRFDGLPEGLHMITASNGQWVVAPNPGSYTVGPDVLNANFTAHPWNTVNLASPSNGAAHIVYAGTNGQVHRLLTSSNLDTWDVIATKTVGPSNYYEYFDPGSVGQPVRFYRSVSP